MFKIHTSVYTLWIIAIIALITYLMPWVVNPGISLTLNGYELAEWASLHPIVRAEQPALLTSLMLRLQPMLILLVLAWNIPRQKLIWWCGALLVVAIAVALLPPLEFFAEARGDGNYQQQFGIALLTLLAGGAALSEISAWHRHIISLFLLLVGAATSAAGLSHAYRLLSEFGLPAQIGAGGVLLILIYLLLVISSINEIQTG